MTTHTETPTTTGATSPVLELRNISKHFGGITALDDVSFSLRRGEVLALVGDNGAGKSTLVKAISGLQPADSGAFVFDGEEVQLTSVQGATTLGIETVYQDLALCDNLDTIQNMFLNHEARGPWYKARRLDHAAMEATAKAALADLGVKIRDLRVPIGRLSGGQRQGVAACRSVLSDPAIVLLDEPTSALGIAQRREVLELILRLRDQNRAVLLISHDLLDVLEVANRAVVMRLGRKVAELEGDDLTHAAMVHHITGGVALRGSTPTISEHDKETSA